MKIRTLIASAAIALTAGSLAQAQSSDEPADITDPISLRMHAMANVGRATGVGGKMLKGEFDYNPRAARLVFATMNAAAVGFYRMFPEGSTSADSEAKETIWSDRAGFRDAVDKFIQDTAAAATTPMGDMETFKEQFGKVTQNCKSCHEDYRLDKD